MAFDADNLTGPEKAVYAQLLLTCTVVKAQEMIQALGTISGKFREAHVNAVRLEKGLENLSRINNRLVSAFSTFGSAASAATGFINASNLSIKAGYDLHIQYNDALVKTSIQFAKHGIEVIAYREKVESIRKSYQLTFDESTKLMSSLEKGFNITGPEKFEGYMESISKITGKNINAMNEFSDAILSMTANNPALEKLVGNLDWSGAKQSALIMFSAGEINMQQLKKFQEAVDAKKRNPEEQAEIDKLAVSGVNRRGLAQGVETGLNNAGKSAAAVIDSTVKWAGGLDAINEKLAKTVEYYVKIQAVAGVLGSAMSAAQGALSGGLDILDALANAKIIFGGKGGAIKTLGKGLAGAKGAAKFGGTTATAGRTLLAAAPGAGAVNAMGAAAIGGSGLAIAGTGLAIGAAAAGGFAAGDAIADGANLGIYDWSNQMGEESKKSMDLSDKENNPIKKAQYKKMALQTKVEQEKMESLGGFIGPFRSEGVASDETLKALAQAKVEFDGLVAPVIAAKKSQQELSAAAAKMTPEQKKINGEIKKQEENYEKIHIRLFVNKQNLEVQRNLLQASNSLLSSQVTLLAQSGNSKLLQEAVAVNDEELNNAEKLANIQISLQKELIKNSKDPNDANAMKAEIDLKKAQEEVNQITIKRNDNALTAVNINKALIGTQEKSIGLSEANIALQDSAGMGLRAQVGARKQLIDQIGVQIGMLRQEVDIAEGKRKNAQDALDKADNQEDSIKAQTALRTLGDEILDKNTKITQAIQKQAEASKAMREGWISAISAMTTGAGVFSRITIDQNNRLGNLSFASPDNMKALRIGGTTGGRTESASWTPGGFKEGKAGAFEQEVMGQYGVNTNNTMQETVVAMMKWQEEKGSKMSPAAAAFGIGPQAAGEITSAIQEGFKTIGKDSGEKSGPKIIIDEKDMEDIKRSFIDAFSKIGTEIVTETLKRIKDK